MPLFPSAAWMRAFCDELVTDPRAGQVASALDGVYRFVVEPDGPLSDRHSSDVRIAPDGDGGAVAELVEDASAPRVELTAPYGRWRQLITGELDVGLALMLRRIKVSGDLSSLLAHMSDTRPLVDSLNRVDSVWLDG